MKSRKGVWIVVVLAFVVVLVAATYAAQELGRRQPRTDVKRIPGGKIFASAMVNKDIKAAGTQEEEIWEKELSSAKVPPKAPERLKPKQILEKLKKCPGGQEAIDRAKELGFDPTKVGKVSTQWWPFGPATAEAAWEDAASMPLTLTPRKPWASGASMRFYSVYMSYESLGDSYAGDYLTMAGRASMCCRVYVPKKGFYVVNSLINRLGPDSQFSLWHYRENRFVQMGVYTGSSGSLYTPALMLLPGGWNLFKVETDFGWGLFRRFTMDHLSLSLF